MAGPYVCKLDPGTDATLKIYLYENVKNIEEIRSKVIKSVWACTIIKPNLIVDPFQVTVAANKAVVSHKDGTMTTKSVNSEILFNLSLTKNISQSLMKFGVENDENILIAFIVYNDEEDKSEGILSQIQGQFCPMTDLEKFTDIETIKKLYKIKPLEQLTLGCKTEILNTIVSRMVTKHFVSY